MMDVPLSIPMLARHAQTLYGAREVVSRLPDKSLHRSTYAEVFRRAGRLARALRSLGVRQGDRIATLAWNHQRHLEAYFAIPSMGAVLHTLNLRLHPDDIAYIATHAGDQVVMVDRVLWPLWEKCASRVAARHVIVMGDGGEPIPGTIEYEALIAEGDDGFSWDDVDERSAAAMCYTSGTTGHPKGVVYTHRSTVLHSVGLSMRNTLSLGETDTVLPVVPMFHVNCWGLPYCCPMVGAAQIFPGPHLDAASLLELLANERVTVTAGVPTIWMGILQALDANPGGWDLHRLRQMVVGGAAMPGAAIRAFDERHGLKVLHAWGMTETSPLGTVSHLPPAADSWSVDERFAYRSRQGRPVAMVEVRARGEDGLVPHDGRSMGELEVRGPWVASGYYAADEHVDRFTEDGWFKTGDVVTIDTDGSVVIQDRSKDLVKSGGEWISSVALEGALMAHPDVAEAAVIAVPHDKWDERPLAVVVCKPERPFNEEALRAHLAGTFAKWWLPDAIVQIDAIPKTSVGKFLKSALRERFRSHYGASAARGG